jgi:prepilin-type N-terminal cleavage/methylation domain-containing protein
MKIKFNNMNATRKGMTLIEMLVAVAILALIILAFGTILTQAQKVVAKSQTNMRTNGTAAAIAKVIRDDLNQLTQDGFLCITQMSTANSAPRLIFTTSGDTPSKTDNVTGAGTIVVMGRKENTSGVEFGSKYPLLAQQKWVLSTETITNPSPNPDVWATDLSIILQQKRRQINDSLIGLAGTAGSLLYTFENTELKVPPGTQTDISNLWQVLSYECNNVSIMWTDGDLDGDQSVDWYGVTNSGGSGGDVIIKNPPAPSEVSDLPDYDLEPAASKNTFLAANVEFETGGGYRALWTSDTPVWPKAIKISFAVHDPGASEEMQAEDSSTTFKRYEVICPIGR